MKGRFENKVALVTGGASGIGMAIAKAFAREGATVVIADVLEHDVNRVAEEIRRGGGSAAFHACDVTQSYQVRNVIGLILENYARLDFACNSAAIESGYARIAESDESSWDRILEVNLTGVYLCMKHEITAMMPSGGSIVNIASVAGISGFPGMAAYSASKHGVVGLTKTAALEYAERGIRVNAVCPGWIRSPMMERMAKKDPAWIADPVGDPMQRLGTPQEIAAAALWLCSPGSEFITGQTLAIDGGLSAA